MIECVQCGHSLPVKGSSRHICEPSRMALPIVGDPEREEKKAASDLEAQNAVADACALVEAGWGLELAIALAMGRVQKAAEDFGFYRGFQLGRAYGKSPTTVPREGEGNDDVNKGTAEDTAAAGCR